MTQSLNHDPSASLRVKRAQSIAYFGAFIVLGLFASVLGPTLPGLAEHTHSRLSEISFLFLARSFGYLLGSLSSGRAFDRYPGHILLAGVLALAAGMAVLTPVVSLLWALTFVLFILGISEGALDVGGNLMIVWVHRERSTPYLNALHFFFGVGAFLMPVIVAQSILISGDITGAYWLMAILPLPIAVWLARLPSPSPHATHEHSSLERANPWFVVLIAVLLFLYVGAEVSFGGWIYTYATTLGLGSETSAAYLTSAFWGALTAGRLLAIPVAARLRPRTFIQIDLLGCIISLGIIILFTQSYAATWIGTIGLGLSMASFFPTTLAYAARRMATKGSITRWFFVGSGAGGMLLPWLIGQLIEPLGPRVVLFVILGDLLLALGLFLISSRFEKIEE